MHALNLSIGWIKPVTSENKITIAGLLGALSLLGVIGFLFGNISINHMIITLSEVVVTLFIGIPYLIVRDGIILILCILVAIADHWLGSILLTCIYLMFKPKIKKNHEQ